MGRREVIWASFQRFLLAHEPHMRILVIWSSRTRGPTTITHSYFLAVAQVGGHEYMQPIWWWGHERCRLSVFSNVKSVGWDAWTDSVSVAGVVGCGGMPHTPEKKSALPTRCLAKPRKKRTPHSTLPVVDKPVPNCPYLCILGFTIPKKVAGASTPSHPLCLVCHFPGHLVLP